MVKPTCYQLFQLSTCIACTVMFALMTKTQYEIFNSEPTGTSLKWQSVKNMPFPAFTLCDHHFENARAYQELKFPKNPFASPKTIADNPLTFYNLLETFNYTVMPNLWKYYFTLDKVINEEILYYSDKTKYKCRVGAVACGLVNKSMSIPKDEHGVIETEVPAGKWISKLLADSNLGATYLCHTMIPNNTVDFSVPGGNSIAIMWKREFSQISPYWSVYVHDKNEHVLLNTYAMESLPSITVTKLEPDLPYENKRKAKIMPTLQELPEPSDQLPCSDAASNYSMNECNLKWGWIQRFEEMRAKYGERFKCQLPGIYTNASYQLPICKYSGSGNSTMGIIDVMVRVTSEIQVPLLTEPPIGIYKETSGCIKRCSTYSYSLISEAPSVYDSTMDYHDFYLYFASSTVETWTEYRLQSGLDFIAGFGGNLGLMLGFSAVSLVFAIVEGMGVAFRVTSKHLRITSKEIKAKR